MVHLCLFIFIATKSWYSHESVSSVWTSFFKDYHRRKNTENHWHRGQQRM